MVAVVCARAAGAPRVGIAHELIAGAVEFARARFTKAADIGSVLNGFPRVLMRLALH